LFSRENKEENKEKRRHSGINPIYQASDNVGSLLVAIVTVIVTLNIVLDQRSIDSPP